MSKDVEKTVERISKLLREVEDVKIERDALINSVKDINKGYYEKRLDEKLYKKRLKELLGKKSEGERVEEYSKRIKDILSKVEEGLAELGEGFEVKIKKKVAVEELTFDKAKAKRFVKELRKEEVDVEKIKYTTYKTNAYGAFATRLFDNFTKNLRKSNPEYFRNLYQDLRLSGIKIFSGTYINIGVLTSILAGVFVFILLMVVTKLGALSLIRNLFLGIIFSGIVGFFFFYYPRMRANSRSKRIKNDLPFAIVNMAAVAGSGSQMIAIFENLLKSEEYKGLNVEIKRVMNYVNLFGYNLNTALKSVASTTPNEDFRDLLNGIVSTSESGGSVKDYLHSKAEDIMVNYKLERNRYVEALSTYSDIYTAILIAAPLLFILVLVIINIIGGEVGGFSVGFLGKMGAFVVVPVLNVAFIVFLNIIKPSV